MEMKPILAVLAAGMLLATPVLAQTKAKNKPPTETPTAAQCTAGYQKGMPWSKQQFTAACAKEKAKDQGK